MKKIFLLFYLSFSVFPIHIYSEVITFNNHMNGSINNERINLNSSNADYVKIKNMADRLTCLNYVTDAVCWKERCELYFCQKDNSMNDGESAISYQSVETATTCSPQMDILKRCFKEEAKRKKEAERLEEFSKELSKYLEEEKKKEMSKPCPKNMTKRWDGHQRKKLCLCLYPFVQIGNGDCVTIKEANEALPKCMNGKIPLWRAEKEKYICECPSNKPWWNLLNRCVTWNEQAEYCWKFGAIVIGKGSSAYCDCPEGTKLNSDAKRCITKEEEKKITAIAKANCPSKLPGSTPLYHSDTGDVECICEEPLVRSNDQSKCITKEKAEEEKKTAAITKANCPESVPGSTPLYHSDTGDVECICLGPTSVWNKEHTACTTRDKTEGAMEIGEQIKGPVHKNIKTRKEAHQKKISNKKRAIRKAEKRRIARKKAAEKRRIARKKAAEKRRIARKKAAEARRRAVKKARREAEAKRRARKLAEARRRARITAIRNAEARRRAQQRRRAAFIKAMNAMIRAHRHSHSRRYMPMQKCVTGRSPTRKCVTGR